MPPVGAVLADEDGDTVIPGVAGEDVTRFTVHPWDEVRSGMAAQDKLEVGAHPAVRVVDSLANRAWAPFAARQKASRIGVVLHGCPQSAIHQWLGPGEGFLLGRDHAFPIGQRLLRVVGVPWMRKPLALIRRKSRPCSKGPPSSVRRRRMVTS